MGYFSHINLTVDSLKAAHKVLAKQLHPDMGGDATAFSSMQSEYLALLEALEGKLGTSPMSAPRWTGPYAGPREYPRQYRNFDGTENVIEILVHEHRFGQGLKLILTDTSTGASYKIIMGEHVRSGDVVEHSFWKFIFVAATPQMLEGQDVVDLVRYPERTA